MAPFSAHVLIVGIANIWGDALTMSKVISLPVPHGLVDHPQTCRVARAALGLLGVRRVLAVDAADANLSKTNRRSNPADGGATADVLGRGGKHLELRPHETYQRRQVPLVVGGLEREASSAHHWLGLCGLGTNCFSLL